MANLRKKREQIANKITWKIASRICDSCFARYCNPSMLIKIVNRACKAGADWLNHFDNPWESEGYKVKMTNYFWLKTSFSHHRRAKNNQIRENQSIRGDYRMKSGRIYPPEAASWVRLWAQSPRTISNDSLTVTRTPIRHQLCSLIGFGHVTTWNPCSSRIVTEIVWLETQIATSPRFAISLSSLV